jgi:hypothetical protein
MSDNENGSVLDRLAEKIASRSTPTATDNEKSVFSGAFLPKGDETPPRTDEQQPSAFERLTQRIADRDQDSPPGTVEGYRIDVTDADQTLVGWFKQAALEDGLTRKQVANLSQKYQAMLDGHTAEQRKAAEAIHTETTTELKTLWGNDVQTNLAAISAATASLSDSAYNALVSRLLHEHFKGRA